ncbi:MAG: hypothetical protein LCH46_11455 [Proteobacteria bacterium]|nr:hypothetical protein [Pseudomonadota bacterium]
MPLQNRVDPFGVLHAVPQRGMMLGNRGGRFHRADRTLGRRRWASHHWICCELHYKGLHHDAMGQGYTSLFFLDEVTALAAGHRPCFFCRRSEAKAFLGAMNAEAFDRRCHAERRTPGPAIAADALPDGAMMAISGVAFARRGERLLRWSFSGYAEAVKVTAGLQGRLLTPPSITAILAQGYQPRWHETALNGRLG